VKSGASTNPAARCGLNPKENLMTSTSTLNLTLAQELDAARIAAPAWYADFEDSRLHVAGSADLQACAELALTAPSPVLRGYVLGLAVNN
jgi:hypothetical protein